MVKRNTTKGYRICARPSANNPYEYTPIKMAMGNITLLYIKDDVNKEKG
jgi:hypothetical protein